MIETKKDCQKYLSKLRDTVTFDQRWRLHDYDSIPEHLLVNMINYAQNGEVLGSFLLAVFSNNLFQAYAKGDDYNQKIIPIYVKFIYNEMPFGCHGSEENVINWMKYKQEKNDE